MRAYTIGSSWQSWLGAALAAVLLLGSCTRDKPGAAPSPGPDDALAGDLSCTWCPQPSPEDCTLCVTDNPLLAVNADGAVSGMLQLCNQATDPVTLALHLSDFNFAGHQSMAVPLAASTRISAVTVDEEALVNGTEALAAGRCVTTRLEASNLWQAGPLTATLRNARDTLVEIKGVRYPMPFNLNNVGPLSDKIELSFVSSQGRTAHIRLRNEDPATYRFRWRLELGGKDVDHGEAVAAPTRTVVIPVELPAGEFSFLESGFLRSGERHGRLVLQHEPDPSFRLRPTEEKSFDVTARLRYQEPVWQAIINSFWILFVLIIGVLISLLVNYALPTQRKRVVLKERLAAQEGRLAGLGDVISSRRLNLLRTEKKGLRDELRANPPWTPTTETELPRIETRIESLSRRIDLTVQAGGHLTALRDEATIALPEAEQICAHCHAALDVASMPAPKEAHFEAARAALDAAAAVRKASTSEPGAEAVDALRQRAIDLLKTPLPEDDIWKPFEDLRTGCRNCVLALDKPQPTRAEYVRAACAVWKAQYVIDFVGLTVYAGSDGVRTRRIERSTDLLKALLPGPDESVTRAGEIVREIEQNVFKEDIIKALQDAATVAWIEIDPPTPIAYQLVVLRVRLKREGLDSSDARHRVRCCWSVSGPGIAAKADDESGGVTLEDDSWVIGHYFEPPSNSRRLGRWWASQRGIDRPERFTITVSLYENRNSKAALATLTAPVTLEATKSYVLDSAMLSLSTLVVTVLLVGLGLLSGAQEKIQSLDWWSALVAVLVLGFGADALKRVLTKS